MVDLTPHGVPLAEKPIERMTMEEALEYREKLVDKITNAKIWGMGHMTVPLQVNLNAVDEHLHLLDVGAITVDEEVTKKPRRKRPSLFDDDDDDD